MDQLEKICTPNEITMNKKQLLEDSDPLNCGNRTK